MVDKKTEIQIIDNDSTGVKNLKVFLSQEHVEAALARALPKHLTAERFIAVALTTISRTPELANCSTLSLYGGIIQASQLGLELDGVLGHAYLVPFGKIATLMIGFKGLRALAIRSGQVKAIRSNTVYSNDFFEFSEGVPDYYLKHRPVLSDRGDFVAAYSIAILQDGGYQFVVMGKEEIEQIRQSSKMKDGPTWTKWFGEMAKKTADRRLCKQLQQSPEMQNLHQAVNLEEQAIGGVQDLSSLAASASAKGLAHVETSVGKIQMKDVSKSEDQSNPRETKAAESEADQLGDEAEATQDELKEMADRMELETEREKKAEKKKKAAERKAEKAKKKEAESAGNGPQPPVDPEDPSPGGEVKAVEAVPVDKGPVEVKTDEAPMADQRITKTQQSDLLILAGNEGWSENEVIRTFKKQFLCDSLEDLTKGQFHAAQRLLMTGEIEAKEDGK